MRMDWGASVVEREGGMQESTIVIFGGSSGVGEAAARLLAERGLRS